VEIGNARNEPFGQYAGERRHVHLDEVGQFRLEDALQGLAYDRMVAADREDAEPAEQVEIARAGAVVEILTGAAAEADVVADGPEHSYHLLVEKPAMHRPALVLARGEQAGHLIVGRHPIYIPNPRVGALLDLRLRYRAMAQTGKNFG